MLKKVFLSLPFSTLVTFIILKRTESSHATDTRLYEQHRQIQTPMTQYERILERNSTVVPSSVPTLSPTASQSKSPSLNPSHVPSVLPSLKPSMYPSYHPSKKPSTRSTAIPTINPSSHPSIRPTMKPSIHQTTRPSIRPTIHPSARPSAKVTVFPTVRPSMKLTTRPTLRPSVKATIHPSLRPSIKLTVHPTARPSAKATAHPSNRPSMKKTARPTVTPSAKATVRPSVRPSIHATKQPSLRPTVKKTFRPSLRPSIKVTAHPSRKPTVHPTVRPSMTKTYYRPSRKPSMRSTSSKKKKSYVGLIVGLCVGLGSALALSILFYCITKKKRGPQHQRLMDITSPRNDPPALVGPISTSQIQPSNRDEDDSFLHGLSVPIPLSPESLELSSSNKDFSNNESDPFPASGGNPYSMVHQSAANLAVVTSTSTEESLGMGLNISPNAIYDANHPRPVFTFPSGAEVSNNTPYLPSDRNQSALYHSGLIHMNYADYLIFDCTVPPGPLGIIVDSTPVGPIIHSIKPSSQLLSILSPGDLIVGLDGINTRGLSAPTLTRLMAKKIQQPERILTIMRHK